MKYLIVTLFLMQSLYCQDRAPALGSIDEVESGEAQYLVELALNEIRCISNTDNKRVLINLGKSSYELAQAGKKQINTSHSLLPREIPENYLENKKNIYISKSMAGDIVVIERLKTHQNVYAYLCERPGYDMTKRTELDGFIAKAGKRADCKLKQFEGDFQLKLYNTQKEHTALSPIRLVRLNYVDPYGQAGEAGNEVPQTVCKKSTSKMAKKLKLGINDSDRDLKKAYERRIDAEVFMMKNIRQR